MNIFFRKIVFKWALSDAKLSNFWQSFNFIFCCKKKKSIINSFLLQIFRVQLEKTLIQL